MNRISDPAIDAIFRDSEQCIAPGMGDVQLMVAEIRLLKAENEALKIQIARGSSHA